MPRIDGSNDLPIIHSNEVDTKATEYFMNFQRNLNKVAERRDPHATQIGGTHYKDLAVEPWKAMEAWLTKEEFIGFLRGNVIKYHARAQSGKGDPIENMKKANHYSQKLEEVLATSSSKQPVHHNV